MEFFNRKFRRKQKRFKRNYDIDEKLYEKMIEASNHYEATVPDIFNACIEELIKRQDIVVYEKADDDFIAPRSFMMWESNIAGLDKLKDKYSVSISKLVNIAVRNAFEGKYNQE